MILLFNITHSVNNDYYHFSSNKTFLNKTDFNVYKLGAF